MPTQRPSKGGPVPKGSRTGGLITMSGRRTEVNKHQPGFPRSNHLSWIYRIIRYLGGGALPAALEPVALAVHLQDVDVVSEPVQQRSGEPLGAEHAE